LDWKATVVREQLTRLAKLDDYPVKVEALPGGNLGWRTRVRYTVNGAGRAGLLRHRSHVVVPVDRCLIAHPGIQKLDVTTRSWPTADSVETIAPSVGEAVVVTPGIEVHEHAVDRDWTLPASTFWQVHPAAAETLVTTVLGMLEPRRGETAWDLYGGAGLFAAALAGPLGPDGPITLVEAAPSAVTAARTNLRDLPQIDIVSGRVEPILRRMAGPVDLVVLDPPRTGAGSAVVRGLVAASPRAIVYVACDPAAFARDIRTFADNGWRLEQLRAFDLFPMTQHVELVALLKPDRS
jgi:tRNA/tmRNA/rRNA uracil-C5-methylase (TrmA/RlmC/RlmD family)